jgi:GTP cyclohydrolase I
VSIDTARIEAAVLEILAAIGEDPARPGLESTPRRIAESYSEFFGGLGVDPLDHLADSAHLAYVPRARIVGLGSLVRVVETLAARPQLQERLTEEIADALQSGLDPRGVLVVLDASHGCVTARGARQSRSSTVTMASRGILTEPVARSEIMALIGVGSIGAGSSGAPK